MRKERPILFSTDMVRATLAEAKTQTRRIMKPQPSMVDESGPWEGSSPRSLRSCPYGNVGDLLWVRESFSKSEHWDSDAGRTVETFGYKASKINPNFNGPYKPSIHLPKKAARIWLLITKVRVERLNEISTLDCRAEGIEIYPEGSATYKIYGKDPGSTYSEKTSFKSLWESIHGAGSWDENPWLWVVEFEVLSTTGKNDFEFCAACDQLLSHQSLKRDVEGVALCGPCYGDLVEELKA